MWLMMFAVWICLVSLSPCCYLLLSLSYISYIVIYCILLSYLVIIKIKNLKKDVFKSN